MINWISESEQGQTALSRWELIEDPEYPSHSLNMIKGQAISYNIHTHKQTNTIKKHKERINESNNWKKLATYIRIHNASSKRYSITKRHLTISEWFIKHTCLLKNSKTFTVYNQHDLSSKNDTRCIKTCDHTLFEDCITLTLELQKVVGYFFSRYQSFSRWKWQQKL